ncbi:MAG TPA: amylo-alpha-1,6-glucosidase [Candidatus Acidoferrum sp.]|nr:amylo-alpha-1,6-glucosidase [Candidatus Acidoferrum sp.]
MTAAIQFGREVCGNLEAAESREWLVTNGIGGYASGTIAGSMTRRYHGLLVAALQPPARRTQMVAWIDEFVRSGGAEFALATHRWASGAVEPKGFQHIEELRLEGTVPVWTYTLEDARLEKRIWMRQGANTTYVEYTLVQGSNPLEMELKALVNYRDFHATTHAGDWRMRVDPLENGVRVVAFDRAAPFYLKSAEAACEARHEWYRDCFLAAERARGLDDREDHLFAAIFRAKLRAGESVTIVSTTEGSAALDGEVVRVERAAHEAKIVAAWNAQSKAISAESPEWLQQLVLAADQFIVKRTLPDEPDGRTVIAGYPWFGDWGRDTMIALPGLTLATGRADVARQILLAFAKYIDGGMLPNNFPDAGGKPEYNTVDAALWYFEAARQYFAATRDMQTLQELFPVLAGVIDAHVKGTRYRIHVDESDGLLYAGEAGVQLTWMDAKVGDWVVTPRTGKAVEINALWINALETMAGFARQLKKPRKTYETLSREAKGSFQKFWNAQRGCCYDVIDAPELGSDPSLRPNQIFAVALPVSPLTPAQQKAVVDICAERLLTPNGLRSLAPGEPGYQGHYSGGPRERDAAYHQGTAWGWLLGPFALAHFRVYQDRAAAVRFLDSVETAIRSYGIGSLAEIYDGDTPFTPQGCIAQAWTVGEVLRAWTELAGAPKSINKEESKTAQKTAAPV